MDKHIKLYSKIYNISEARVKELLGIPSDIETNNFMTFDPNSASEQDAAEINNTTSRFETVLKSNIESFNEIINSVDNPDIQDNIGTENNLSNKQKIEDDNIIEISEPKEVKDILKIGIETGTNAQELAVKAQALKEGEYFLIKGRQSSINNVGNNSVYKVEMNNGRIYITEVNVFQRAKNVPQETIEEFISILPTDLKQKMSNLTSTDEFRQTFENMQSVIANNTVQKISKIDLSTSRNKKMTIVYRNGTFFRVPVNHKLVSQQEAVEAIALNIEANSKVLDELDEVLTSGKYTNLLGKQNKIKIQNATLTTPENPEDIENKEDPIVIYFENKIEPEVEEAIIEIARKYAKKTNKEKELSLNLDKNPLIMQEYSEREQRIQDIIAKMGLENPPQLREFIVSMISTTDYFKKYKTNNKSDNEDNTSYTLNDEVEDI